MSWWAIWTLAEWVARLGMIPIVLRRRLPPMTALAWLAVIFLTPELGILGYLLFGGSHLGKRRIRAHRRVIAAMRSSQRLAGQNTHVIRPPIDDSLIPLAKQARSIGGFAILGGNDVELLSEQETVINRLIADIDAAKNHVHLLFYIFEGDTGQRVCEALQRASKRGVATRVLVDAAGSRGFFKKGGFQSLICAAGGQCHAMLPAAPWRRKLARIDLRNHRKIAVIDGAVAYAGSQNIASPMYGPKGRRWVDVMGRFTGPVVAQLQMVFIEDWAFETGDDLQQPDIMPPIAPTGNMAAQTVPTGPSHETEMLPKVLLAAINAAQHRIIITTPYMIPDEPTIMALSMAADRGVQVQLVVPEHSDHPLVAAAGRAYYHELMAGGVHIYHHQRGLLHSKTMTVDDAFALLGSSNLDIRSFYLNFEVNVLLYGSEITAKLRAIQTRYLAESLAVNPTVWDARPQLQQYFERIAALGSPLL